MISDKINALFSYINFLHSNIENFMAYNSFVGELEILATAKNKLSPPKNFVDKVRADKLQAEMTLKYSVINENVIKIITAKATELNICDIQKTETLWNWNISEISDLKQNFDENDIPIILDHKTKYLEFRITTNCYYFQPFFFQDLDQILKVLFDFFKDNDSNEFELFETKKIKVNSIEELAQHITKSYDTRFWLSTFADEKQNTIPEYRGYKSEIDRNGRFKVNLGLDTVNIYTPELAIILTSEKLLCKNMDTQIETEINCLDYLKTYINGYKEGEQYFDKEFNVSPNTLYGQNAEQYVRDIHLNFFHINHTGAQAGWSYVKKQIPVIITHKTIKDFGFYSGVVSKVETMVKKYPKQFQTFDICDHQLQPQQTDIVEPDEVYKTQNLFKVGLLFAKGEMNKYFNVNSKNVIVVKSEFTAPKIAKKLKEELGIIVNDKFILASMKNYTDTENKGKNIFNSFDMMTKIISHCEAENITVDTYFMSRLPIE